jgi:hypothetical protein
MVELSEVPVSVTRGGRNPLLLAEISRPADALGVEVPIPTCAKPRIGQKHRKVIKSLLLIINMQIRSRNEFQIKG